MIKYCLVQYFVVKFYVCRCNYNCVAVFAYKLYVVCLSCQ
jgi:hypothetical protein